MNGPLPSASETELIYEILEFWFSTTYTEWDRTNHIKPLDELTQSLEKKEVNTMSDSPLQQALNMPDQQIKDMKSEKYWDRHSAINHKSYRKWYKGDEA